MDDMPDTVSNAIPGEEITENDSPQAASAADTPASMPSGGGAEGSFSPDTAFSEAIPPEEEASVYDDSEAPDPPSGEQTGTAPAVYRPVYNGQEVPIRADDTERVTALLRQGLRFEKFAPQFETLRRMSLAAGFHRPEELVEDLEKLAEQQEFQMLLEKSGGNQALATELLSLRKQDRAKRFQESEAAKEADEQRALRQTTEQLEERLAEGYCELKRAIPEVPEFGKLPKPVIEDACQSGRSLLDAYLRFERQETLRRVSAQKDATAAAAASAGSLTGMPEDVPSDLGNSFSRAFRAWL